MKVVVAATGAFHLECRAPGGWRAAVEHLGAQVRACPLRGGMVIKTLSAAASPPYSVARTDFVQLIRGRVKR